MYCVTNQYLSFIKHHKLLNTTVNICLEISHNIDFLYRDELEACIALVREKNNKSLTGISVPKIISMVDKELKEKASKKQGTVHCFL